MFEKNPLQNGVSRNINEYSQDLEDRVETTFTDHDSKLMQLLNWMGLVKDYVVEQGSNYTKWNSGKLEQYILVVGVANANGNTTISGNLPATYTASNSIQATLRTASSDATRIEVKRAIDSGTNAVNIVVRNNESVNQNIQVYIHFLGRWK